MHTHGSGKCACGGATLTLQRWSERPCRNAQCARLTAERATWDLGLHCLRRTGIAWSLSRRWSFSLKPQFPGTGIGLQSLKYSDPRPTREIPYPPLRVGGQTTLLYLLTPPK